jgi:hypothetical protein
MEIKDCLNNQFLLYTYLDKINSSISQYLENNNANINYYCIHHEQIDNVTRIITSKTNKKERSGHRLITIVMKNYKLK